ncbi:amidohydrolase family protein [Nocardioides massiliensis]|uniref:Aminocarboxymuconate-semialdehyde decarboxylase n=1 Tax=Nocardioides massiliensis TaxID=1325935 RepID=A0ABT9NTH8_9ACTN|nr:amidohydrolase family protein [Nocardioides massiliensis]MDP9823714.1 aminocarboxymuconate-semialdehyde decarboxylase [Nocardioides massiliensis]
MEHTELPGIVDSHAHFFPAALVPTPTADPRWPLLRPSTEDQTRGGIYQGDRLFRAVDHSLWDVDARLRLMDAHGIAQQIVSPVPVMLTTWADPAPAARFARSVNEGIATAVGASRGRLVGLATVPLQDVRAAIRELEHAVDHLGLAGVEIGTRVEDRELDDPELAPFFATAADLGAVIFVHPMDGGTGAVRREGQPYDFGFGMLSDTALAATALLTGGVIERHPDLRMGFAHGCGTLAWAAPRLGLALSIWGEEGRSDAFDDLLRQLWVDTLVLDPAHLPLLVHRFGADRVMVGTDAPFIPSQLAGVRDLLAGAREHGLSTTQTDAIARTNGRAFFTREDPR